MLPYIESLSFILIESIHTPRSMRHLLVLHILLIRLLRLGQSLLPLQQVQVPLNQLQQTGLTIGISEISSTTNCGWISKKISTFIYNDFSYTNKMIIQKK